MKCLVAVLGQAGERFIVDHLGVERRTVAGGAGVERIGGEQGIDVVAVGRAFENLADGAVAGAERRDAELVPLESVRNIGLCANLG